MERRTFVGFCLCGVASISFSRCSLTLYLGLYPVFGDNTNVDFQEISKRRI